jgi:cobalt-zinc-cadmium resistance protein CzcA
MRYYGIALQQLYTALGRGNANVGGSKVTQGSQQYLIRGVGMLHSADEINDIVITAHNGTPVLVKDIAAVTLGNLPVEGIAGQDKDDDIVFGIVDMHKGDNPSVVLKALKAKIAVLNNSILPKGVKVVPTTIALG